jgi:hypothetical protein
MVFYTIMKRMQGFSRNKPGILLLSTLDARRMEWAELHQAELRENWTTLATEGKFNHIAPLVRGEWR